MKYTRFVLRKEHIKLLSNTYVSWNDCEFGAPAIDCKRPYGNSGDLVFHDMIRIIGVKKLRLKGESHYNSKGHYEFKLLGKKFILKSDDGYDFDLESQDVLCNQLDSLHKETETALQIVLATKSFNPGTYEVEEYSYDWKLVKKRVKK